MAITSDAGTRTINLNGQAAAVKYGGGLENSPLAAAFARKNKIVRRGEKNPNCETQYSCDGQYLFVGVRIKLTDVEQFNAYNPNAEDGILDRTNGGHAKISDTELVMVNDKLQGEDLENWYAAWEQLGFPAGEEPAVTFAGVTMMMKAGWNPRQNVR